MIDILSQKATIGFYFHIPFCPHICPYCDFIKTSKFTKKDIIEYFNELKIQLKFFINNIPEYHNKHITVYFGGGTPGLFEASYYKELFDILNSFFYIEEATLETNPLTNLERRFEDYLNVGFNRITLGAQSLCSNALKILGRKHTPENILNNIKWAKNAGFKNIQVDLIYGLKNGVRTISVKDEIESLYEAGSSGISAYALTIEKRTLFAKTDFANDDIAVQEYYEILNKTPKDEIENKLSSLNHRIAQEKVSMKREFEQPSQLDTIYCRVFTYSKNDKTNKKNTENIMQYSENSGIIRTQIDSYKDKFIERRLIFSDSDSDSELDSKCGIKLMKYNGYDEELKKLENSNIFETISKAYKSSKTLYPK